LLAKVFFFVFVMMWFRGTLPRIRIDHLLDFGWKFLVPLSLFLLIGVAIAVKLPLSETNQLVRNVALLAANLVVFAATLVVVFIAARRSRDKGLRSIAAVDPITASE
jgi:NADH-quinone oxidoreductase subunit H